MAVVIPPPFQVDSAAPSQAVVYDLNLGIFHPIQVFEWDNITTCASVVESGSVDWSNWVPATSSWTQVPYVSWAAIPTLNNEAMYIGTESGYIMRFFQAVTDNMHPVAYNATWGLQMAPNLNQTLKPSWIELYLKQIGAGPNSSLSLNEAIEADVLSFIQPLDVAPLQIVSLAIALADQSTFFAPILPGPTAPANVPFNWLQLQIQGSGNPTSGNFVFAGATLYCYLDNKNDYQSSAGVPTR